MTLSFFVPGLPVAQGSITKFPVRNRPGVFNMTSSAKGLKPWRYTVAYTALEAMQKAGAKPTTEAVAIGLTFVMHRPKRLSAKKPTPRHGSLPDMDKLIRAIFDALTGVAWQNDSQVDDWLPMPGRRKRYAEPGEQPGVHIAIEL